MSKKLTFLAALCLSLGLIVTSCKGEKKESREDNIEVNETPAAEKADIAMNDVYQCPMDCEKGKTYHEEGKCPVCKMDLKKVEKEDEQEHENGDKHEDHDGEKDKENINE